jgi:hypothetical protein
MTHTPAAELALIAHLESAQADGDMPLTLLTGETRWPDADIIAVVEGWVTIRYTVWHGATGYNEIARLRLDAITALVYPAAVPR